MPINGNRVLQRFLKYNQLVANGKPPKVALVAIMRKLLGRANALVQVDQEWCGKLLRET